MILEKFFENISVQIIGKKDLYIIVGASIVCGVAVPLILTSGLSLVGFGSAGVKAKSVAAIIHSGIGNVAGGSLFSSKNL